MSHHGRLSVAWAIVFLLAGSLPGAAKPAKPPATPPGPPKMLEPVNLGAIANAKAEATTQPAGIAKPPFELLSGEKNALDVSTSLSGWKESDGNLLQASRTANTGNGRLVFSVPADNYSAMHLLAYSTGREGSVPRMTVRIGHFGGGTALMQDTVVEVPELRDPNGQAALLVARTPVALGDGKTGWISRLRVPMAGTANVPLSVKTYSVEFTRDLNMHLAPPAPSEFVVMPAGRPSGVVVLAVTMERSPVQMEYSTAEYGNIFWEGQPARFDVKLTNRSDKMVTAKAMLKCFGPGTGEEVGMSPRSWTAAQDVSLEAGQAKSVSLDAAPSQRGWYSCQVAVEADGRVLQARDTSFAVLAPDTRKARGDSPFGVWCFWGSHARMETADRTEKLASLLLKSGRRWTYGGSPLGSKQPEAASLREHLREKYLFNWTLQYPPYAKRGGKIYGAYYEPKLFEDEVVPWLANARANGIDNHYIVLHEARTSKGIYVRFHELFGGKPYVMPPEELEKFNTQYEHAVKFCTEMKKADPTARVVFGNDYPGYLGKYMERSFPKDLVDVWGLEGAMTTREPERQPDWVCLLGQIHLMKRLQAQYGYDKPMWFTEALYHNTSPGTLSLHQQANIYVREAMLALSLGVQRLGATGVIVDCSDSYRWSHWGSTGFCFMDPEYNPKPSFVMYSWMTQVLDQAKPDGKVDSDSTALHVLKFRKGDGSYVCPVWVVRGRQEVQLATAGGSSPVVYDAFGNELKVEVREGQFTVAVGDSPIYVVGPAVTKVLGRRVMEATGQKADEGRVIVDFDNPEQLTPVETPSEVLETAWPQPRIKGNLRFDFAAQEDGASGLRVELLPDGDDRKLLPRYVELALKTPVELPGRPWALVTRVKGNGGWGRIMFELVDVKGRIWTSSGNQHPSAPNSNDPAGDSSVSFDGWGTVRTLLPGQYPGQDQFVNWPGNHNWWPRNTPEALAKAKLRQEAPPPAADKKVSRAAQMQLDDIGDEPVDYPVKLTKIIVEMRAEILYVDQQRPVGKPVIFLDRLCVVDPPPGM